MTAYKESSMFIIYYCLYIYKYGPLSEIEEISLCPSCSGIKQFLRHHIIKITHLLLDPFIFIKEHIKSLWKVCFFLL